MAYTAPTAADLKARFPAFASVADAVVTQALAEAALMVDDSWLSQVDFSLGRMLLAAHYLVIDGHGTGTEAQMGASGLLGFSSIHSGQLSLSRAGNSGGVGGGASVFESTSYGQRFLALLKQNKPAVVTV